MAIKLDENVVTKNGNLMRIKNQNPGRGANKWYWFTTLKMPDGCEIPVMITEHERERIEARAAKNEEDVPEKNFFVDLLD
jgi:hypothetical protein